MFSNDGLVDLNSAGRKLLTQLPGVSKTIAYRIVNYRSRHGGFRDWMSVEAATHLERPAIEALAKRAFIGPRHPAIIPERSVISRWQSKPKHA